MLCFFYCNKSKVSSKDTNVNLCIITLSFSIFRIISKLPGPIHHFIHRNMVFDILRKIAHCEVTSIILVPNSTPIVWGQSAITEIKQI